MWLKCAAANGAVASPATAEDDSTAATGSSQRGAPSVAPRATRRRRRPVPWSRRTTSGTPAPSSASGRQQQDHHRRQRHRPQGQRALVDQHRAQHHRHHDKGALRRHRAARQHQIAAPRPGSPPPRRSSCPASAAPAAAPARCPTRTAPKTTPASSPICSPEIASRCARFVSRIASSVSRASAGAVAGDDGGGEGAGLPRQRSLDRAGKRHAQPVGGQRTGRARRRRFQQQHRCSRVADGPQTLEPRHALKIETAGLRRPRRRRQVPGQDDGLPRLRVEIALDPVQRHPHPRRRARRGSSRQHHPVQRQPQHVAARAVDLDDPPLDRSVIAVFQHRRGLQMRPRRRQHEARRHQHRRDAAAARPGPAVPGTAPARPARRLRPDRSVSGPGSSGRRNTSAMPSPSQTGTQCSRCPRCLSIAAAVAARGAIAGSRMPMPCAKDASMEVAEVLRPGTPPRQQAGLTPRAQPVREGVRPPSPERSLSMSESRSTPVVTRFAPSPTGLSAYRRRPDGAVQLALCARARRQVPAADRGYRPRPLHPRGDAGDPRRAGLAAGWIMTARRSARPPARRGMPRSPTQMLAAGHAYKCFSTPEEIDAFREPARAEGRSTLFLSPWRDADRPSIPTRPMWCA